MLFSVFIGILDGLGLSMFLPLLHLVSDSENISSEQLGSLQFLVDFLESTGIPLSLISVLGFMAIFFFAKGVVQYKALLYKVVVQQWFIRTLRIKNIEGLNRLAYKYFVLSDIGRIQNTLTGEVARVAAAYKSYFDALQYGILVIVYMAFAFFVDYKFAILVTIGGILTNFLYKRLYENTKGASRRLTDESNIFQSLVIQNVANYKYLKATGAMKRYGDKLKQAVKKIEKSNRKIGQLDAVLSSAREPILVAIVVVVIYIQTTFLGSALGPILISLVFFYRALGYLMQMQLRWNKFLSGAGALENLQEFGKELKRNRESMGSGELQGEVRSLSISDAYLSYDQKPVLKGISLEIHRNETVALVGESGSGKTTLVNVLAGLLPLEKGSYKINNIESQSLNLLNFQERIGYITQDPVIFNDTVFNNISFWREGSDENKERFWEAVKSAAIFDFIMDLPDKENTVLGNNGVNLSGGQRQRISIARELFKEVEILILDEATSALDSETEKEIQSNIDSLKGKYTLLIVAHRISTIKNADRIVILKNGQVSETGSFEDLRFRSDYFGNLVALQEL